MNFQVGWGLTLPVRQCLKRTWERRSLNKEWWVSLCYQLYEFIHQMNSHILWIQWIHTYNWQEEFCEFAYFSTYRKSWKIGECTDILPNSWYCSKCTWGARGIAKNLRQNFNFWKNKSVLQHYYCKYGTYGLAKVMHKTHEWQQTKIDIVEFRTGTTNTPLVWARGKTGLYMWMQVALETFPRGSETRQKWPQYIYLLSH